MPELPDAVRRLVRADPDDRWAKVFGRIAVYSFALTRMICHAAEARRRDEAEHGVETGRIVMTPEGGFTEIREPVAPLAKTTSLSARH